MPQKTIYFFNNLCYNFNISFAKYSGSPATVSTYSPLTGCINPRTIACNVCPSRWGMGHFLGPYTGSPSKGCPILAIWTRIWWVRPVFSSISYVYNSFSTTNLYKVMAFWPLSLITRFIVPSTFKIGKSITPSQFGNFLSVTA